VAVTPPSSFGGGGRGVYLRGLQIAQCCRQYVLPVLACMIADMVVSEQTHTGSKMFFPSWSLYSLWYGLSGSLQPLHDLRLVGVLPNFMQVEFYVSQNFPNFNSVFLSQAQENLQKCALKCTIKRLKDKCHYKREYNVCISYRMQNMFPR
jgi:hypothetical protein